MNGLGGITATIASSLLLWQRRRVSAPHPSRPFTGAARGHRRSPGEVYCSAVAGRCGPKAAAGQAGTTGVGGTPASKTDLGFLGPLLKMSGRGMWIGEKFSLSFISGVKLCCHCYVRTQSAQATLTVHTQPCTSIVWLSQFFSIRFPQG